MEQLIKHLTENFGKPFNDETEPEIIRMIRGLDREQRGELRYRLFNETRRMDISSNGQTALFWLQNCFEMIDRHQFHLHKVFFSPGTDIIESISGLLSQATKTLDICVFTITDGRLAADIISCMERGVRVRIITDDQKMFDHGSAIKNLKRAGIPVKIDHSRHHMHHKFGIIDSRIVITGSFNWTYSASNHNQENLLVTSNYDIVKQYSGQFEVLWEEMFKL